MGTGRRLNIFYWNSSFALSITLQPHPRNPKQPSSNKSTPTSSIFLIFDGPDTITTIDICGQNFASTNNQFRQWTFDATFILRNCTGNGTVKVTFNPAPLAAVNAVKTANCEVCFGINYEWLDTQYIRKQRTDFG